MQSIDYILFLWSWRDSNPRPNRQYISLLHAQFSINCREKAVRKRTTFTLSSEIFVHRPKLPVPYFRITISRNPTSQNETMARHLASLLSSGKRLKSYFIRIKLQERTLRCQLKVCSKGFKRSRYGSLHAYLPIGPAVETSQPRDKDCKDKKNTPQYRFYPHYTILLFSLSILNFAGQISYILFLLLLQLS